MLTKIDPNAIKYKPPAVSQYAARNGTCVTTGINPIRRPPVPPVDPLGFDIGPANFNEEHFEDDVAKEDTSRAYYVTRVCDFHLLLHLETNCC